MDETPATVAVLRLRSGPFALAVELEVVGSVVAADEVGGIDALDLADALGHQAGGESCVVLFPRGPRPIALWIDEIEALERWDRRRIAPLPRWLTPAASPLVRPVCGVGDEGEIVWLLDPAAIRRRVFETEREEA